MIIHSVFVSSLAIETDGSCPVMYPIVEHYLAEGYSVAYCVESARHSRALRNMGEQSRKLENHIRGGALHIADRDEFYSHIKKKKSNSPAITEEQVFQKFESMVDKARNESSDSSRKMIYFGQPAALYEPDDYERLLVSEQAVERFKERRETLEIVCCYDASIFSQMALWQAISILNLHSRIFHAADDYNNGWSPSDIFPLIGIGIDKSLGKGTSELIMSTLKLVYDIDVRTIIRNPAGFEATMAKVIGRKSDDVIKSIKNEIINRLTLGSGSLRHNPNSMAD